MTISTTATSVQYLRNGTTTQWSYPNKVFAAADLIVTDIDTAVPPNAVTLVLNTDYTVSNVDVDIGALVTTTSAGISGHTLDIRSNIVQTQATSIKNQGSYLPELHEEFFDRITREVQDLTRKAYTYGIHGSDIETTPWTALPAAAARSSLYLGFDTVGNISTKMLPGISPASGSPAYAQTLAEAAAGVTPTNLGYPPGNVLRYGADVTGVANSLTAFSAAAVSMGVNGQAFVPAGIWKLSANPTPAVTWVIDAGATFTGAGSLCVPLNYPSGARTVKLGGGGTYAHATKIGAQSSWLETLRVNTEANSDLVVLSSIGQTGLLGGSKTSDFATPGSMGCIGGQFWAINDNTTQIQTSYGLYIEGRRNALAGSAQGLEINITNFGGLIGAYPNSPNATGITEAFRVASGGGAGGALIASTAISIINNGAKFEKGIIFQSNAIDTASGEGVAVALPIGFGLVWYDATTNKIARIRSDATAASMGIVFSNGLINFQTIPGVTVATIRTDGVVNIPIATGVLQMQGIQVVGPRVTGWGAATGGSKAAFTAGTATLAQTAAAIAQLISDLTNSHGLIGA
jgi:hypothetical protein